jgi:hypothetical protein
LLDEAVGEGSRLGAVTQRDARGKERRPKHLVNACLVLGKDRAGVGDLRTLQIAGFGVKLGSFGRAEGIEKLCDVGRVALMLVIVEGCQEGLGLGCLGVVSGVNL